MTPRELEEYRALRATIGQRGSLRLTLVIAGFAVWAATAIATASLAALPVATLLPLLLLAVVFEVVFQLHTGVERVGRYLQVFYDEGAREWERTTMAYGKAYAGGGLDPLFSIYFALATIANFIPVLFADPVRLEVSVVGVVHLGLLARVYSARHAARKQRSVDLERFERLKVSAPGRS